MTDSKDKPRERHYQITDAQARLMLLAIDYFNTTSMDAGPCIDKQDFKEEASLIKRLRRQVS